MVIYLIAGIPNSVDFGHAKLVAEKLKNTLPFFSYKVVVKLKEEYQDWLNNFCLKQKWVISYENPFIWRRFGNITGPCTPIGGISNFFEILNEYYNVDTRIKSHLKKQIALDNVERITFKSAQQNQEKLYQPTRVCITGATYPSTSFLTSELLQLKSIQTKGGIVVHLHNKDIKKYSDLMKIKMELRNIEGNIRGHNGIIVVNSIEEGLINCDLLIVMGSIKRKEKESFKSWTKRNYDDMMFLSCILNLHCPKMCKILLMGMDLLCFNLNVLAEHSEKVYLYNFVGVTAHFGMETLSSISRATNIPISELHCPPVWGFIGYSKYIDYNHIMYHTDVQSNLNPKNKPQSKFEYYKTHKFLGSIMNSIQFTYDSNECSLKILPEIRATVTIISEWFGNKSNKSLCAAIFSDGTFNLPFGIFMSQPVVLEDGEWKPYNEFPAPTNEVFISDKVMDLLNDYNLGKRFTVNWRESTEKLLE
ncbi:uncharacterized protein LOC126908253 [Daktulosphaira vitifoliae]|uniref:uncharacterized protein LOC126908253 n=1 Tax=Daktulosphaira vitifoliae TaxID=58002 RepID=UPI0021AA7F19|nr:uncharacterized protein LOC126908253 [Daktulosphaira vitifoliae]